MEIKRPIPWLVVILLIGAGLRIVSAAGLPLWLDEAITWDNAQKPWGTYLDWSHNPLHAPLSYILVRFSIGLFGDHELALRLPSLLAGILNIGLVYLLGKRIHGAALGLLAAALFAVDPLLVRVDAYARMYAPWMCVSLLAVFTALWVDETTAAAKRMCFKAWILLALVLNLCFWTHPLSIYLWVAVFAFLGLRGLVLWKAGETCAFKHRVAGLLIAAPLTALLGTPGLVKLLTRTAKATAETEGKHGFAYMLMDFAGTAAWPVIWMAALVGLACLWKKHPRATLLLVLIIISAFVIIGGGKRHHHLTAHYLYPLAISVYLGLAAFLWTVLEHVHERLPHRAIAVLGVLGICLLVAGRASQTVRRIHGKMTAVDGSYEGSRLVKYVAQNSSDADAVILVPPWLGYRASFYALPARRLELERRGHLWVDDFCYDASELDARPPETLWFLIETWCGMGDKRRLTKAELKKFLSRSMKEPPDEALLEELASKNVIRVRGDAIESFTTSQILKGQAP